MSLKTIHLVFIVLSIALAIMMALWATSVGQFGTVVISLLVGVALTVYAVKFARKARRIGLH